MAADRFPAVRDLDRGRHVRAVGFFWRHPEIETVILRPVHIVGPTIRNAPSNYLRLERPLTVMGFDPMVQLIHEEDVAAGADRGAQPGPRGRLQRRRARARCRSPPSCASWAASPCRCRTSCCGPLLCRLFKAGLATFPPEELDHLQFLCVVDGSRAARELGWTPRYSLRETIRSVLP